MLLNDDAPLPKVIDFGIAKATQGKLTDQTLFTALEQFIGTPAYMSPEQAELSAKDIDTLSDTYSVTSTGSLTYADHATALEWRVSFGLANAMKLPVSARIMAVSAGHKDNDRAGLRHPSASPDYQEAPPKDWPTS